MIDHHGIELSEEQQAARDCQDRFIVVVASAGSGKTEVVAQRVERLLAAESGFRVVAVSYTRRAAAELRDRFTQRLEEARRRVETDTLHGFAQGLLLQYGTWIGLPPEPIIVTDDADRVELLQDWRAATGAIALNDPEGKLAHLDLARAQGQYDELADDWDAALAEAGALDYEAMLARAQDLLDVPAVAASVSRLFKHVIVDEAQNLTSSQYEFLKRLVATAGNGSHMMLVGDDKQSIVGFAGASPRYLKDFIKTFGATVFRLTQNFRSAARIASLGERIANDLGDPQTPTQQYAAPGVIHVIEAPDERSEADGVLAWVSALIADGLPAAALASGEESAVRPEDIAILGRTAASVRQCRAALERAGHQVAAATHPDDWLSSDMARAAWLLATFRPTSPVSQRRLSRELGVDGSSRESLRDSLTGPSADFLRPFVGPLLPSDFAARVVGLGVGTDEFAARDVTEILAVWERFCDLVPTTDRTWPQFELFVARWQRGDDQTLGVRVHTVHKAQGREFKAVALVGLNDGQFPDFRARTEDDLEAEKRAFYVAVTRASRALLLARPRTIHTRNGQWARPASRFLAFVDLE